MVAKHSPTLTIATPSDREIVLTRHFTAPRELVFKAMTSPDAIPQWWGPRDQTTIVDKMDVRPGGAWRFIHRDPEGNEFGFNGVYREVIEAERLVYTFEFEPMAGHVSLETITFEDADGGTLLTNHVLFDSVEDRDGMLNSGMETGATESMDRLEELLGRMAAGEGLYIERIFDAPRELVWQAWSDAEHLKRWWGPAGFSAPRVEVDFRVGGKWLASMQSPEFENGRELFSTGVYKEIVPLKRIVTTDSFADEHGNVVSGSEYGMEGVPLEMMVTVTFEDVAGGKTKMTLYHAGMPAGEHLTGATEGWNESLDKLAKSLA